MQEKLDTRLNAKRARSHRNRAFRRLVRRLCSLPLRWLFLLVDNLARFRVARAARFATSNADLALATLDGMTFVVSTSDGIIGRSLYVDGSFDFDKFERAYALLDLHAVSGDLVLVDIGANIGSIGLVALHKGLVARCLLVEPEPFNLRLLRANISLNELEERCTVIDVALGESPGSVELELSEDNLGDHRVRTGNDALGEDLFGEGRRKTYMVPMRRLDDYLDMVDPAKCLIWMDTQGYEGWILSGARRFLQAGMPIVLEFWPYGMDRIASFEKLLVALGKSPYTHFIDLDDNTHERRELSETSLRGLYRSLSGHEASTDILLLLASEAPVTSQGGERPSPPLVVPG